MRLWGPHRTRCLVRRRDSQDPAVPDPTASLDMVYGGNAKMAGGGLGAFIARAPETGLQWLAGLSLLGGYLLDGLVQIKRAVPTLALIPLVVIWFGVAWTIQASSGPDTA